MPGRRLATGIEEMEKQMKASRNSWIMGTQRGGYDILNHINGV
jgi:hypothetical protein